MRARALVGILVSAGVAYGAAALPAQDGILSDRQLRQRLGYAMAQQRAVIAAAQAALAHDSVTWAALHARITRDSLAAITPVMPTVDSVRVTPSMSTIRPGDTLQLCAQVYYSDGVVGHSCVDPALLRSARLPLRGTT